LQFHHRHRGETVGRGHRRKIARRGNTRIIISELRTIERRIGPYAMRWYAPGRPVLSAAAQDQPVNAGARLAKKIGFPPIARSTLSRPSVYPTTVNR
jgi:hypothetical protein